jgi:multidrug efflux pump subunit AcrA (membrane-fusion protein)
LASSDSGKTGVDRSFDQSSVVVERGHFRHILRLSGTVSALQSYNVQAPRLFGQTSSTMVITKIVQNGTQVQAGDVLVEFDSQSQMKNILDKQAEHDNLIQQIRKKQADHDSALAVDETEIKAAEVDVQTARVEMRKNEVIPGYQAEINKVNLAEAEARLKQLKATFDLKREAQAAELRILEIQRDRAKAAADHAHRNIENMTIRSPMSGLVVLTPSYRGSIMVDPQEGDEVRPGGGIMMVVNPFQMEVLARANQVDISQIYVGQPAKISLDAYPDLVFPGKIKSIGAIGIPSNYIKRIRYFSVVVSIQGSHPKLLPDLTAAVDLELADEQDVLIVPREAVAIRGEGAFVEVLENGSPSLKSIEIGLMNECEAVIESGLEEGMIVSINPETPTGTDDSLQDQTKGPR